MSSSNPYQTPPPTYHPAPSSTSKDPQSEPLLSRNSVDEQQDDDLPEDFKIGVTVSQSSLSIRQAFKKKVYSILFLQIAGTTLVGGLIKLTDATLWFQQNTWAILTPSILAIFVMLGLFWKRQSHPWNIILLGVFTLLEAISVGAIVSFYDQTLVLQALLITTVVFLGLTIFTFQSKYDFSNMGSYLFGGLMIFVVTGFVGIFFPFSRTLDAFIAGGGCILFCGYILYDTWLIENRLSPDDWVMACVSLYLDVLNLFLNILRLLSDLQDH